ncbi:MAG: hypothetical protein ACTSP9_04520 [Promethearchaeota archaeon]
MITWILGILILIWCIVNRAREGGKIEGYPLGMPRGTVRALITLMIVAFPFNYLLIASTIPVEISNALFILVAFYFEARKSGADKLKLIREVKNPEKYKEELLNEKFPLYFPKYTVRILLAILLVSIYFINILGPNVAIETSNTIFEILTIIALYFIGNIFRTISVSREKKKLKKEILKIEDYKSMSKHVLYAKLAELKPGKSRNTWKNLFSIITFIAITTSLMLYTIPLDYTIPVLFTSISLRHGLLLIINVYYGFRD